MERQGHAAAHRDFGHLPAVVARNAGTCGARPGEPPAGARPALPPAGGVDPRQRPGRVSGLLDDSHRRTQRLPLSAQGPVGRDGFRRGFTGQTYTESTGRDLYRRSMYTVWKRTVPPPALVTFDAPDREKCTARRSVTNTPLQALVLLNDPTYVEAARFLAARMLTQGGKTATGRINYAFRLATGRIPDPQERAVLVEAGAGSAGRLPPAQRGRRRNCWPWAHPSAIPSSIRKNLRRGPPWPASF